jgi:anthranilate phosphoribosyltransferase
VADAVLLNAAAALVAHDAASNAPVTDSLGDRLAGALVRAREAIDTGAARDVLARWVQVGAEVSGRGSTAAGA